MWQITSFLLLAGYELRASSPPMRPLWLLAAHSSKPLSKLLQKPHVTLKEQLNIIHAVFQDRDAVRAHAEGKSGNLRRIVSVISHELEHVRIDHAASENFYPSSRLAGTARFAPAAPAAAADETTHHHFGAGLGEREERWAELGLHA